jgi:cellobiose epimerase
MKPDLQKLKKEFEDELTDNILNYWATKAYDPKRQTFFGRIGSDEKQYSGSPLSAVFTTRILWTFSAASRIYPTAIYRKLADAAYNVLMNSFLDNQNGGIYWSVTPEGKPVDTSKQFYAQAFMIYALSEYFLVFGIEKARETAVSIYRLLEKYGYDNVNKGFFEAKSADWKNETRSYLTPVDGIAKKSMNTHLHLIEAFTNLYRTWKDEALKTRLYELTEIFLDKILNKGNNHFHLFFSADWKALPAPISFGHDIEGSWLLQETAEVLGDHKLLIKIRPVLINMAYAVAGEAIDNSGGIYNEADMENLDKKFIWWVQTESVVGFFNAWQLSADQKFLNLSADVWNFIRKYQIDHLNGEWFSQVNPDLSIPSNDKVNGWKGPYHNGRMCMEMIRRIGNRS